MENEINIQHLTFNIQHFQFHSMLKTLKIITLLDNIKIQVRQFHLVKFYHSHKQNLLGSLYSK